MSSHSVSRGCLVVVLGSLACGPSTHQTGTDTNQTITDADTTSTDGTTSQQPDPTTGQPPGETMMTDPLPDTSTGEPPDSTGGEPVDCPKGQNPFTARWATLIDQPEFNGWGAEWITATADGRIAVLGSFRTEDLQRGYGVTLLSKDGEPLGTHLAPFKSTSPVLSGIAPAGADGLVVLGGWLADTPMAPFLGRFAGDGSFAEEVALGLPHDVWDARLGMLDTPVLFGRNVIDGMGSAVGTKVAPDGVSSSWTTVVDTALDGLPRAIATDADGQVLFVSGRDFASDDVIQMQVVDSAGALVWSRTIEEEFFGGVRDAVAFPGGWAVLRGAGGNGWPVRLLAVAAADGATLWDSEVAAVNEDGPPMALRVHLIGDHLTIPVVRTLDFENLDGPHTVAAHRVGLDGAPFDVSPLWEGTLPNSMFGVESTVGACGELVTMSMGTTGWARIGGYVP
ncbi:hypothetical protein [Nannocystis sp. SCPEA4]|uniref:hypothetical protein n=1 Tax=Nannocystis sp. SCPEA4 TaxID=2996787 RepID=UPI0022707494|nr:hypothetical protein [Nannocystis sp. SCPEA4]MCY1061788.1 hypothetical protein [Nannocystis sp. SCPEA4]